MTTLRLFIVIIGWLLSLFIGINQGVALAESVGGKVVLSIIFVLIGWMITGFVSRILGFIDNKMLERDRGYPIRSVYMSDNYRMPTPEQKGKRRESAFENLRQAQREKASRPADER